MKIENRSLLKAAAFVILLFVLFLFALNGRYESLGNGYVLDKWKKEVNHIGTKELPVITNSEEQ